MAEGRQDLAAVIAELQSELAGTRPPIRHRERVHCVPRSLLKRVLALLLAEAPQHQETKAPEHVCGLSGYNGMIDPPCPACEYWRALVASGRDADGPIVRPSALLETRGVPQEEKEKNLTRMAGLSTSSDASRTAATDVAEGARSTTPDQGSHEPDVTEEEFRFLVLRGRLLVSGVCDEWDEAPRRMPQYDPRRCLRCARIEAEHVLRRLLRRLPNFQLNPAAPVTPADGNQPPSGYDPPSAGPLATAATNETTPTDGDGIGLSIDMLDVDRLRQWADNLLVYGPDVSQWGDRIFVAGKMQQIATGVEKAVRDIGLLRLHYVTPNQRHEVLINRATEYQAWRAIESAHGLVRNLLSRLPYPDRLPAPEVIVEDDGDLCFDWNDGAATVSASLRDDGLVRWAALIGDHKAHGRFQLPAWADDFNEAMTRLGALPAAPLARAPQAHTPDCASWRGVSAHPESEPLPCDCPLAGTGAPQEET